MIHPAKAYLENKKDNVKFKIFATKKFIEKYIKRKHETDPFLLDENKMLKGNLKKMLPGKIYTFEYDPLTKDSLAYYDTRPIVFMQGIEKNVNTKNVIINGVNLNFIPSPFKVAILARFYELFEVEIEANEDALWKEKYGLMIQIFKFFRNWLTAKKVLEHTPHTNFGFANRNYIQSRIKNLRVIDYDDWQLIPFLIPREILGADLKDIYKAYVKSTYTKA